MENPGLTISPCEVLNPATLLPTPEGSLPFHSCLETLDQWTKPQEGLSEDPLTNPEEIWYTDGSSFVLGGKRRAGYAVVSNFETIEAEPLPPGTSGPGIGYKIYTIISLQPSSPITLAPDNSTLNPCLYQ